MSMSEHGHDQAHDSAGHDEHVGIAKYIYVFIALCVLTSMSFFTYSSHWPFPDQPNIGRSFMMAVSCTKALLVILFFMHVKYEANWKYVLTIPAAFMSMFLLLALVPDVGMRGHWLSEERRLYMAEPRTKADHEAGDHATSGEKHDAESKGGGGH
jgi:cytochrome c oxidase subunit IV